MNQSGNKTRGKTIVLSFNAKEKIVDVSFPPPEVRLETRQQIDDHFDFMMDWWRRTCGEKVYFLVDYQNFFVDLKQNEHYGKRMKELIDAAALGVVRYGGDSIQRTGVRLYSLRLHSPSNLYASRDEALEVVERLRAGTLAVES